MRRLKVYKAKCVFKEDDQDRNSKSYKEYNSKEYFTGSTNLEGDKELTTEETNWKIYFQRKVKQNV